MIIYLPTYLLFHYIVLYIYMTTKMLVKINTIDNLLKETLS